MTLIHHQLMATIRERLAAEAVRTWTPILLWRELAAAAAAAEMWIIVRQMMAAAAPAVVAMETAAVVAVVALITVMGVEPEA